MSFFNAPTHVGISPNMLPNGANGHFLRNFGVLAAGALGLSAVNHVVGQRQIGASFDTMLQRYPELGQENPDRVRQLFSSISNAAPDVAKDPTVTGSLIKKMLNYDGIDHATYMELVKTQESFTKNRNNQLSPMTSLLGPAVEFSRHLY
jgi:hypothetical protein